jgi:hypothetical protein
VKVKVVTNRVLLEKVEACLTLLNVVIEKGDIMAGELAALQAQITKTQETEASAILIIQQLANQISTLTQQLADAIANQVPAATLIEMTTALDNSAQALAAAVAANTPTAPA